MKKAKVVENKATPKNRLITGKRAVLLTAGAAAALGVVSVVVPTSNIPGFSYIAQAIGLQGDDARNLTMADYASYAAGIRDNKIAALRQSSLSGGPAGAGSGSGLSPFSTLTYDRLAEAYAKNAKEAAEMEKSFGGTISPFDKTALDRNVSFDPELLAKGFDPSVLTGRSQAAYSGAMEALAAAAGKQAEAFGKPITKEDLQATANLIGIKDANLSNIVGGGNIAGIAKTDDSLYETMRKNARALMGTSVFGVQTPEFSRTDTRVGRPVFGIFKDLGNAFFFSRYARGAKLPTAASDLAAAAWDGAAQDKSIITQGDNAQETGVVNPEQELASGASSVSMCSQVREIYTQMLKNYFQTVKRQIETLYGVKSQYGVTPLKTNVPGLCYGKNENRKTLLAREVWNSYLDGLEGLCNGIRSAREGFAGQCNITFSKPEKTCRQMARSLHLAASKNPGVMIRRCRNLTAFGVDKVSINRSKYRRWERKYDEYIEDGYTEDQAAELADNAVPISRGDIEGAFDLCDTEAECKEYINRRLEEGFAFQQIIGMKLF